jgi:hypothetical protein
MIRVNYCNHVMIKDLLLHCCILQRFSFEYKKILRLDVFSHSLLET